MRTSRRQQYGCWRKVSQFKIPCGEIMEQLPINCYHLRIMWTQRTQLSRIKLDFKYILSTWSIFSTWEEKLSVFQFDILWWTLRLSLNIGSMGEGNVGSVFAGICLFTEGGSPSWAPSGGSFLSSFLKGKWEVSFLSSFLMGVSFLEVCLWPDTHSPDQTPTHPDQIPNPPSPQTRHPKDQTPLPDQIPNPTTRPDTHPPRSDTHPHKMATATVCRYPTEMYSCSLSFQNHCTQSNHWDSKIKMGLSFLNNNNIHGEKSSLAFMNHFVAPLQPRILGEILTMFWKGGWWKVLFRRLQEYPIHLARKWYCETTFCIKEL